MKALFENTRTTNHLHHQNLPLAQNGTGHQTRKKVTRSKRYRKMLHSDGYVALKLSEQWGYFPPLCSNHLLQPLLTSQMRDEFPVIARHKTLLINGIHHRSYRFLCRQHRCKMGRVSREFHSHFLGFLWITCAPRQHPTSFKERFTYFQQHQNSAQ